MTSQVRTHASGLHQHASVRPRRLAFNRDQEATVTALEHRHALARPGHGSARAVLALQRYAGNAAVAQLLQRSAAPTIATVQRYVETKDTEGDQWRVSESGKSALWVQKSSGGQSLFAADDLIADANEELKETGTKGSHVQLTARTTRLKRNLVPGVVDGLKKVVPELATFVGKGVDLLNKNLRRINKGLKQDGRGKKNTNFALWADCGRASRAVMGIGERGQGPSAVVRVGGVETPTAASKHPASFSDLVYKAALPDFMRLPTSARYLKRGVHKKWIGGKIIDPTTAEEARKQYWQLGEAGRRAFDRAVEVNVGADPKIGGAYATLTEEDMPGFKVTGANWNFHWAGVVMKDGDNNITLENYAVNMADMDEAFWYADRNWVFQMYGTKKKGQTFHEERMATGTHGTRGSTFAVRPEGY